MEDGDCLYEPGHGASNIGARDIACAQNDRGGTLDMPNIAVSLYALVDDIARLCILTIDGIRSRAKPEHINYYRQDARSYLQR